MRAFTLIELLVVLAIIALLASSVLASLNSAQIKARDQARIQVTNQIGTALGLYASTFNSYPAILEDECGGTEGYTVVNNNFMQSLVTPRYLPSYPVDPGRINCGIQYVRDSSNSYRLFYRLEGGQTVPATGCNQPPTWFCIQP